MTAINRNQNTKERKIEKNKTNHKGCDVNIDDATFKLEDKYWKEAKINNLHR